MIYNDFILPRIWELITNQTKIYQCELFQEFIGKDVFWASVDWHDYNTKTLPQGHRAYIVKTEGPNVDWIVDQSKQVDGMIFVLCLPKDYGFFNQYNNIKFFPYYEWHYQFNHMIDVSGSSIIKNINKKISVHTARVTQSKALTTAAVIENYSENDRLVGLSNWIENKNVHKWGTTGIPIIDRYQRIFIDKLAGKQLLIKNDNWNSKSNNLTTNSNFNSPSYQQSAININNESYHYSYHQDADKEFIFPGPFITEKTLKCLVSATAFLSNGQFDTYSTLSELGFNFDYGIDLSYDSDPGNLSRLAKLLEIIENLSQVDTNELYHLTRYSSEFNRDYILSQDFFKRAEQINQRSIQSILNMLS